MPQQNESTGKVKTQHVSRVSVLSSGNHRLPLVLPHYLCGKRPRNSCINPKRKRKSYYFTSVKEKIQKSRVKFIRHSAKSPPQLQLEPTKRFPTDLLGKVHENQKTHERRFQQEIINTIYHRLFFHQRGENINREIVLGQLYLRDKES